MSDLNSCSFTGRVTKDAVTETIGAKQTLITRFAIANNTGFGQYEKTNFINVQVWGNAGASIAQYLKKGKQVAVSGPLENQKWVDKNNVQHDSWTLTSQSITLLADAKNTSSETSSPSEENNNWEF